MRRKCKVKGSTCCKQFDGIAGCNPKQCLCSEKVSRQIEITKPTPCNVPEGEFQIDIEELRRQVKEGKVEAGAGGLQSRQGVGGATKVPKGTFHNLESGARRVPQGAFLAGFWDILFGTTETSDIADPIGQFVKDAPYAVYAGKQGNEDVWTEEITDSLTGVSITLAYTTSDNGKTAEAYCIDPDLRDHNFGQENVHCYTDGRLCTDLHSVKRNLPEKRARAILWVSGFCNYLKENRFAVDE